MSGFPCGNNPGHSLTPGDRAAVEEFRAYLAARRSIVGPPAETDDAPADEPEPCPGESGACMWKRCTGRGSTCACMCPVCVGDDPHTWGYDGDY